MNRTVSWQILMPLAQDYAGLPYLGRGHAGAGNLRRRHQTRVLAGPNPPDRRQKPGKKSVLIWRRGMPQADNSRRRLVTISCGPET